MTMEMERLVVETEAEAKEIIRVAQVIAATLGFVTLADVYTLVGIQGNYIAEQYGWETTLDWNYEKTSGGLFRLSFPDPIAVRGLAAALAKKASQVYQVDQIQKIISERVETVSASMTVENTQMVDTPSPNELFNKTVDKLLTDMLDDLRKKAVVTTTPDYRNNGVMVNVFLNIVPNSAVLFEDLKKVVESD